MNANRTLANAQAVIELLAESGALSPADIAQDTGIARSSVYRLTEGLAAVGLAEVLPDSRVQLTRRWLHLADAVEPAMKEWALARRVLDGLSEQTGQTAFLTVRRGVEAICIAWAQGRGIDLLILKPGRSLPLYAGAAGRMILAHSPELAAVLLPDAPFEPFTDRTLTDAAELHADIARTLEEGCTFSDEDVTLGIGALGVPVLRDGGFLGCISVAGLSGDIRSGRAELLNHLRRASSDIVRA